MDIETARGIAGRVWCDPEMSHVIMDADLAEAIAKIVQVASRPLKSLLVASLLSHKAEEQADG